MKTALEQSQIMSFDPEAFRRDFNEKAVLFTHTLATHPLFDLPRVAKLAAMLPQGDFYVSSGKGKAGTNFDSVSISDLAAPDAIAEIEKKGLRVLLKRVEQDPEYRELLDQCVAEVLPFCEPGFKGRIRRLESFVFITAPDCITPYHMDPEIGFFFQVRGDKHYNLFDRSVTPPQEIEKFYSGTFASLTYREQQQNDAQLLELKPGCGFIQPVNAPHWVGTGDSVAISYTFAIETSEAHARARTMRANGFLRRAGIKPAPYGSHKLIDSAKAAGIRLVDGIRKLK